MSTAKESSSLPQATISEQDGVRYLHLDTPWVQGAMLLRQPRSLVLEYVQRMMAWMLWRSSEQLTQGHAVQLGLGAAASWSYRSTHNTLTCARGASSLRNQRAASA